ncbi:phosphate signaling complex protein PhoU [Dehalogenimonas alkenigignens]|uniref:Phosphate-specific transport system accessory protein PhoU n=1 Tax=Dehalogenimonas alkenigignens TaxID=1217799 RepID=A0A0W0GH42_9CHLR|nr:phosphate signaling complex protein PhoU [Dehalogenimonas alkenigignens]KTB47880.1 phosphate uptake regulator, PhoU [Dehalogenimonas alkenigignens]PVV83924.1 phosphate transport system regulatory protein PhoU [Dehalogenimonas alkenigignens]
MRVDYERNLKQLQDKVLALGSMVEKAIGLSMEAMKNRDIELARKLVEDDELINVKRYEIEEDCIHLIATQAPMARDLRVIVAVLNIIIDLERIGDHAAGNAKIAIMLGEEPPLKPLIDLPRMSDKTADMLHRALDAFIKRDATAARAVTMDDDEVDALYDQIFRELLFFMAEDPKTVSRATRLIWAAHNLERSADRVTNICERVVFVVTGKQEEIAGKY